MRLLRRPPLERAAYEARVGMPLPFVAWRHGCDEGAILAAAGLTFETQKARVRYRAERAFAAAIPPETEDLDALVLARFDRER